MENIRYKIDSLMLDVVKSIHGINPNLYDAIEYVIKSGGKRIRALLLIKICDLLNVDQDKSLICGTALEMIHNYSLIHDDLPGMDNDDYRRGIPTCHKKFGEGLAILAGNGFYTLGLQLLVDGLDRNISIDIIKIILASTGITGLLSGQADDISGKNHVISSEEDISSLIDRYYLKTGKLFEAAFLIPGILANADREVRKVLVESGGILGVLYQLADDIADGQIEGDIIDELKDSLLSRFYTCIDSLQNEELSVIKSFARECLAF